MAYSNGNGQKPTPPEPVVVERGDGISVEWRTPAPPPPAEPRC
ncbi:hypothetical protein ACIQC7_27875 [Kitasatospora sp. NPDC088556]